MKRRHREWLAEEWHGGASPRERTAYDEARWQVYRIRKFYRSLAAYATIVPLMALANYMITPKVIWVLFPAVGWGIGLFFHALNTFGGSLWLGREWEEKKIAAIMAKEKIRVLSTEKQVAHAQLRMLQAQIEPHFLFNTLANVVSLIDVAPDKARLMLETFIAYLRSSLAISRQDQSSLASEEILLQNYLSLLQIRMGDRLSTSIRIDPGLASHPFPPMLLQPLVENAIKHGLEPKIEGGHVGIHAFREGDRLKVEVLDNGQGFGGKSSLVAGTGLGLNNIRERLAMLYDGQAVLIIQDAQPGTRVLIDLPFAGVLP
jgi:LytS/YehU family sensor histidine kinase